MNKVLVSTKPVVDEAKYVRINRDALEAFCRDVQIEEGYHWMSSCPIDLADLGREQKIDFTFVFNSINFCYWGFPKWTIQWQGKDYDGAWALVICLKRAFDQGTDLLSGHFLKGLQENELSFILEGNIEIPLFKERLKILNEVGSKLSRKYNGFFSNLILKGDYKALDLLDVIVDTFPSFNDTVVNQSKGREVSFHKRAQLLLWDINHILVGGLEGVEELTAFADYKVPQNLRKSGILVYSPELAGKVDRMEELPESSREEIEIRAGTVWAVELLRQRLSSKFPNISAPLVDSWLWKLGQNKSKDDLPYHRTSTIYY